MKSIHTIKKNVIYFEDLDFKNMTCVRGKKDRQIFFHDSKPIVYKTYVEGWEYADTIEQGINSGFYDLSLIPNFIALIQEKNNKNRGYATYKMDEHRILSNQLKKNKINTFLKLINKKIHKNYFQKKPYQNYLVVLLFNLFFKIIKTELIFTELNIVHIWQGKKGYHIFDLDSLREIDWLLSEDKNKNDFLRSIVNRDSFNKGLKELIELHGFQYPFKIVQKGDIPVFWETFVKKNKIESIPKSLLVNE